jgi:SNF2 family DNA or RNA helicase
MGLGKTIITLFAIADLLRSGQIKTVLIVAPKRVAQSVWSKEIEKWQQISHLTISKILGTEKERKKALTEKTHIHIVNKENLCWLLGQFQGNFPYDMLVIDELSAFKSHSSARFKALVVIRDKIKRVFGLTGTPRPNGLIDLWSQMYILDGGKRLGHKITHFREEYFTPGQSNGHVVYNYNLKGTRKKDKADSVMTLMGLDIHEKVIYEKIGDICISMKAKDYLELPPCIYRTILLDMDKETSRQYYKFERDQVIKFQEDTQTVTATSAAVLTNKLLQFANGGIYYHEPDRPPVYAEVHKTKLDALEEIIEEYEGSPVMVFYWYKHDLDRLKRHFSKRKPRELKKEKDIDDWNAGKINLLFVHPQSAGHGLNLQAGGNIIVWFSMIWSLELYLQANARLDRQGQLNGVIIHHLIMAGTMDEQAYERLLLREQGQNKMMEATKAVIKKYQIDKSRYIEKISELI